VSFAHIGNGSCGYPPRNACGFFAVLKPFLSSAQISNVSALVNEMLQGVEVAPDRIVDDQQRVVDSFDFHIARRLTAVIGETPHESQRTFGEGVDWTQRSNELGHIRMVEGSSNPSDVVLGEMKFRHHEIVPDTQRSYITARRMHMCRFVRSALEFVSQMGIRRGRG
jgi:hypothetical protein